MTVDVFVSKFSQSLLFYQLHMVCLLQHLLCDDPHTLLLSQWLDVRSLTTLDVAISSITLRPYWATLLGALKSPSIDKMCHCTSSLMWLIQRGICTTRIQMKVNAWRVPGCDLSLLKKIVLLHLGLNGCSSVTDKCILKAVNRCDRERSDDSGRCSGSAENDVSELGHGCG